MSVIDFFVFKNYQRKGIGFELFEKMMKYEKLESVFSLAFEKMTPSLMKFLNKNYKLTNYIQQNNGSIIFNEYFKKVDNCNNTNLSNCENFILSKFYT